MPVLAIVTCSCRLGTADVRIGSDQVGASIDAGEGSDGGVDARTCAVPWGPAEPLAELNSPTADCGGQISPDGLTYYFNSMASGNGDIFVSHRANRNSPFDAPLAIAELNTTFGEADPSPTPDELEIYFTSDRDGSLCIYRANRATTASAWGPAIRLDALCTTPNIGTVGPFISADRLTLYYNDTKASIGLMGNVLVSTRPTAAAEFGAGTPMPALSLGATAFGYPTLSPDGLTLYVNALPNQIDIWQATRSATGAEFGAPSPVVELNGPAQDGDASITADGSQIFFSSGRLGSVDLYVALRSCP